MKQLFLIAMILFSAIVFSQNSVKFDYDAGGNMTQKKAQIVSLRLANKSELNDTLLNFKVYPNPAKDQVTIEGALDSETKNILVLLYDINGALVRQYTYDGNKKSFPVSGLTSGIYFLEVKQTKKQSSSYRLFITE